jgi:hypothetical protein
MKNQALKIVRPDAKGRITLGIFAKNISSFIITQEEDKIILIPYTEIPAREKWLFNNKEALDNVKQGLKDSYAGNVRSLGSFKKHLNENIE